MAESRYDNTPILLEEGIFSTQQDYGDIKRDLDTGVIRVSSYTTVPLDRLDIIANKFYREARYWWIIAIANDIGWGLQVPSGTKLRIPLTAESILERL